MLSICGGSNLRCRTYIIRSWERISNNTLQKTYVIASRPGIIHSNQRFPYFCETYTNRSKAHISACFS